MTWIDIVISILIAGLVMHGIFIGLIRGAFDIAGIIAAYILAINCNDMLRLPRFLAFLVIFIIVAVGVSILGRIISKAMHATPIGIFDRLFGGLLGLIKGLIISFVFILIVLLIHKSDKVIDCSELAPLIVRGGLTMSQMLPKRWYERIEAITTKRDMVLYIREHETFRDNNIPL
ncbi:CvpA family protein [candidate division WOR-3 bacterium]|nr:CvpA family protein [candidate division WOR-3 bacterium]